jgi:DNA-binding transcriptional LysR family regulator
MLDYKIQSFMAVIEQGTLKKASDKLGLTQPAVSQHLKSLEEYYKVPLFDHIGRKLVINDAGLMLRHSVEQYNQISQEMKRKMLHLLDGRKSYRIGATLTIGEFILPAFLGEYRLQNPHLELSLTIENTRTILHRLDRGEIDIALIEGPFDNEKYQSKLFLEDEMVFIGTEENFGSNYGEIGKEELESSRLILREKGSGTRFFWEEYLNRNGIKLTSSAVIMEVGSLSAIKSLVESGFGCSVMSNRAVKKELLLGLIQTRPFRYGPLKREMHFVYTDNSPEEFITNFIGFVEKTR